MAQSVAVAESREHYWR